MCGQRLADSSERKTQTKSVAQLNRVQLLAVNFEFNEQIGLLVLGDKLQEEEKKKRELSKLHPQIS